MRTIKVAYKDWWEGFCPEEYIYNEILSKHYNLEISEDPDYIFCSLYSFDCLKYDAVRIFTTGDNYTPDFNIYDYALAFDYISFGDRYIRVPNWIMNPRYKNDVELMLHKSENVSDSDYDDRKFCSWVCSNGNGDEIRQRLFKYISGYKQVDSGGRFMNNIGQPSGVEDKLDFQKKYRFSLAIQDSEAPGYLDEKLIQSFSSRTVPIFWGDNTVSDFFNPKSMINVHDYCSDKELLEDIINIDSDKKRYLDKLSCPAMKDTEYVKKTYENLESFLINIIERPLSEAKRRPRSVWHNQREKIFLQSSTKKAEKKLSIMDFIRERAKK